MLYLLDVDNVIKVRQDRNSRASVGRLLYRLWGKLEADPPRLST